jgi:methionine synthase II (cobalamin-independent)
LQAAYADYDAGRITRDQLESEQDEAVQDSITRGQATGAPIISDGEQRWSSFATYAITDTLAGTAWPTTSPATAASTSRSSPTATTASCPADRRPVPLQDLRRRHAGQVDRLRAKPMKQAVIAPSMLALLVSAQRRGRGYPRERVRGGPRLRVREGHPRAFDAGAARVSIDFTEGRLATRADPRNPWTGAGMLPHFIELNNRVLERFTAEERVEHRRAHVPRAAIATRCTAPTSRTATCSRACSR